MAKTFAREPPNLIPGPTSMPIVLRNQTASPLLRLSGELCNHIFELALDLRSGHILHDDHNDWNREDFTHTCHQIYSETARTYYKQKLQPLSENGVSFGRSVKARATVAILTPSQRSCIDKAFFIATQVNQLVKVSKYLVFDLPNLRKITVRDDIEDPQDNQKRLWAQLNLQKWGWYRGYVLHVYENADWACLLESVPDTCIVEWR
ncbi:hypothetical protein HBI71_004780 [Parastagonospora nodorum]|nr:hypothetical protein HBI71_004780 [Parastagonospora nodorum]KAH5414431.1 hypothetical protein HBI47_153420 [Parastagonospora nodorum]